MESRWLRFQLYFNYLRNKYLYLFKSEEDDRLASLAKTEQEQKSALYFGNCILIILTNTDKLFLRQIK